MKFYEKNWFIALSIMVFFPLGLFLLWKYTQYQKKSKIIITVIVLIIAIVGMGSKNTNNQNSTNKSSSANVSQQSTNKQQPSKQPNVGDVYYLDKSSVVAKDTAALMKYYDYAKENNTSGILELRNSGKIMIMNKNTSVTIATPTSDKEVTGVVINEGTYDLKDGYTFTKWLTK